MLTGMAPRELIAAAIDLVLPVRCPGCDAAASLRGLCTGCERSWRPHPHVSRPSPAPAGLPTCVSAAPYADLARALILAYKEHHRRALVGVLGDALAAAVSAGAGGSPLAWPLVLVPVPGTAASVRARQGDHMLRLARRAARRLRRDGWPVSVARPLRARRKADSAHLDRAARARAAEGAFVVRPRRVRDLKATAADGVVVLLDDVLTTGATLAAVARRLQEAGVPVAFAATIAATRRRPRNNSDRSWDEGDAVARKGYRR